MKLETFFEKFDQFADAPNAVAKMRELVLELAVQGKLVDQNASDEPCGRSCSKRFAEAERATLVSRSDRRNEHELPAVEQMLSDSASWRWARLGDIGDLRFGRSITARPRSTFR